MKNSGKNLELSERKRSIEDDFILVESESLSLDDKFMKWKPRTETEYDTKELIKEAINKGIKNFCCSKYDPSFSDDGENICYLAGKSAACGKSYLWWEKVAKQYFPEKNSRLGTRLEYGAFLGVLIKNLVKKGKSVKRAWNEVCNDSIKLGYYWNSKKNANSYLYINGEPTGSRCVCGFYDLANVYKILAEDFEGSGYYLAGGVYSFSSDLNPIAGLSDLIDCHEGVYDSVGWIVIDV